MMRPVPITAPVECAANKGIPVASGSVPGTVKASAHGADDAAAIIVNHGVAPHRLQVGTTHFTGRESSRHLPFDVVCQSPGQYWFRGDGACAAHGRHMNLLEQESSND